jgi:chemotaxis signal transduction protein
MPIETPAGLPPIGLGLAVIRGTPTPVVDGAWLFGNRSGRRERFVLIRLGKGTAALAVDDVIGIGSVGTATTEPLPPLLGDGHALAALQALDGGLAFFVHAARIVPDDVLTAIALNGCA